MNTFDRMTEACRQQGWNDDGALFVALNFISALVENGRVTVEEFQAHLDAQIDEENSPLPLGEPL